MTLNTCQMVVSCPAVRGWVALFPIYSFSQSWEQGGWWTWTWASCLYMSGLHHIQVVDHIKMVDNTNVK